jgi:hypothetical protein
MPGNSAGSGKTILDGSAAHRKQGKVGQRIATLHMGREHCHLQILRVGWTDMVCSSGIALQVGRPARNKAVQLVSLARGFVTVSQNK